MKYYNHFEDLKLHHNTVITLGKFDGLHEGHRNLIETMMKVKEKKGLRALIFTFSVPPKSHITGQPMPVITTNEEKRALFEEIGVDYFIECPFSDAGHRRRDRRSDPPAGQARSCAHFRDLHARAADNRRSK